MRIFDASNPVGTEAIDVISSNGVVVHLMSATVTDIQMFFMFAVFLVNTPALRATLTGICGRHFKNKRLVFQSLVDQFLLEVIESP